MKTYPRLRGFTWFAFWALALAAPLPGVEKLVHTTADFNAAVQSAQPGDQIVLADGEWRDALLKFTGRGRADAPIVLRAQTPGEVRLTGRSRLRMGGDWLVAEGLWFQNPATEPEDVIELRADSQTPAHNSRLTGCAVTWDGTSPSNLGAKENRWISIYGTSNRVDHCRVQGKVNRGTTLVVWLGGESDGRHRVERNWFGPRPRLGVNGGETIRVGDSSTSMRTAECVIEGNVFERCDGEAECVSNKSGGNIYRRNYFLGVSGTLTLRHGNGCLVEQNVFLGRNLPGTGGIRVIGADHVVRGNHLEGLAGDEERSALTVMQGIPSSPLSGYAQVQRARLEGNRVVDCRQPVLIGLRGGESATLPPTGCVFLGNQIHAPKVRIVEARCGLTGISWNDNVFWGRELGMAQVSGVVWQAPVIAPTAQSPSWPCGPAWWSTDGLHRR